MVWKIGQIWKIGWLEMNFWTIIAWIIWKYAIKLLSLQLFDMKC